MTELCFAASPRLDAERILAAVQRVRPDAELVPESDDVGVVIAYRDLRNMYPDARSAMLLNAITAPVASSRFPDLGYAVLVADLLGQDVPPEVRVQAYQAALAAVVDAAGPLATWWPASQQALPPDQAVADPLRGLVNVRLHDLGEVAVMDTLGLYALGLPDLQCRFRYLDRSLMGDLLRRAARFQFGGGRYRPDAPMRGFTPDQRWPVRPDEPFLGPDRPVLTIDPGDPFSTTASSMEA